MAKLHFDLVSPEKRLMAADVHMVVVPGEDGDFGVLAGHAPFMSTIRTGIITVYGEAGARPERLFIDGGFAEVTTQGLTILAEEAVALAELDFDKVSKDLINAREDVQLAKSEAQKASAQAQVAKLEVMLAAGRN
jgi:F-type H+-transporting ATPase subunit epsilon